MEGDKRQAPRIARELRLRLAYASMDDFIERFALNISSGGVFVRTRDPSPPGTELLLDISLESGEQVIHGRGVVRWTTPPSAPGEAAHEPGMGIKFTELSRESRALVELVVGSMEAPHARSEEPPLPAEAAGAPVAIASPPPLPTATSTPTSTSTAGSTPTATSTAAPTPTATPTATSTAAQTPTAAPTPTPTATPRPPRTRGARPSGPIVGIDLGTTNSCVAFAKGGKARVLASRTGQSTVPSVVAYDADGRLLVGRAAKAQMVVNPRHTVYGSKRLIGRPFASPTVQACRDRFHYEIVEAMGGGAAVRFAGRDYSLEQVSALILGEMRAIASDALGEAVSRAVITVPAYYNDHQRSAVREAGALAGLTVERIVNEPTAAALAFGYGRGLEQRVLVYDLGGGTFDASVLQIHGDVYEVVSTGGDTFLGGVDFDAQLVDHLVWRFMERNGFAPPQDPVAWQRIRDAAEELKVSLSERERAVAHVPFLCRGPDGGERELREEVTREELEALTARLVERTLEVCREVLGTKGLEAGELQEVLLVGGQSRMPAVHRAIAAQLGRQPNRSVHPDEAVALGAALLADSADRIDAVVLIDVLPMAIGVGLPGGRMVPVLPRNAALPASKSHEIATTHDGQTELELQVFQGDSPRAAECEYLGTVRVDGLASRPKGEVRVAVEFAAGAEGLLTVTARDLHGGRVTAVRLATLDTPESLRQKLKLEDAPVAPRGARPIDVAPAGAAAGAGPATAAPRRKGFFGRLFGGRS